MDRPQQIETRRSHADLRASGTLERLGYKNAGLGRFVHKNGGEAKIKFVRPGVYTVVYT